MRRAATLLLLTLPLLVGLAAPVLAIPFEDPKTGFKVDPPEPFDVLPAKSQTYDIAVVINSRSGSPAPGAGDSYLCQVGYKALPDNAGFAQEDINLQVQQPQWLDGAAAQLAQSFDVTGKSTFMLGGATGIELIGKPRDPAHAAGVFVSMVDTPAGRTTLNCATPADQLDTAVNAFRLIRASITLPEIKAP